MARRMAIGAAGHRHRGNPAPPPLTIGYASIQSIGPGPTQVMWNFSDTIAWDGVSLPVQLQVFDRSISDFASPTSIDAVFGTAVIVTYAAPLGLVPGDPWQVLLQPAGLSPIVVPETGTLDF